MPTEVKHTVLALQKKDFKLVRWFVIRQLKIYRSTTNDARAHTTQVDSMPWSHFDHTLMDFQWGGTN
jgi:hypothetical protein